MPDNSTSDDVYIEGAIAHPANPSANHFCFALKSVAVHEGFAEIYPWYF